MNLFCMQIMQYIIITCFADRAWRHTLPKLETSFFHKNAYKILYTTYQIGIFFSRTSIQCFKIPQVWILTTIQQVLFIVWTFIAIYPSKFEFYCQTFLMLLVGLLGGFSYSNCLYAILDCKTLTINQKEVTITICSVFYDNGIFIATLISQVLSGLVLK